MGRRGGGRRWKRLAAWGAGMVVVVPLLLVALLVGVLHEDSVATWLARTLLRRVDIWPGAEVTVGRVDLGGFWRVSVRDLRVGGGPTAAEGHQPMASVERLDATLRLLPLVRKRVIVEEVSARGVDVVMRQAADSTWDLLAPFTSDTAEAGAAGEPLQLRIGSLRLDDADLRAAFLASSDSVLRVEGLRVAAREISYPEGPGLTLDTLDARIFPPLRPASPARLSAALRLLDGGLSVEGLRLVSDSSDVVVRGSLRLPDGEAEAMRDIDFQVVAAPLDFRDLDPFVPGLDVAGSARLEGWAKGSADRLEIEVDGRTFDGAVVRVSGSLAPPGSGAAAYTLEASVRDLDPGLWREGEPMVRDVDVDVAVDLRGPSLDSLTGGASAKVSAVGVADGVGRGAEAEATFERGRATFELNAALPPWAGFVGNGTARPFDELPSYELRGVLRQLEAVPAGAGQLSSVVVEVEASGQGIRPEEAGGRARLVVDGVLGTIEVTEGIVQAAWGDEEGEGAVDVALGGGRLVAALRGEWGGDEPLLRVSSFELSEFDLTPLLGDSASGTLSMSGNGEMALAEGGTRVADVEAVLEGGRWGGITLDSGAVAARLRGHDLTAEGRLVSRAGTLTLDATARPFDPVRSWRIERLAAHALDLSRLGEGLPESAVDAVVRMEGTVPASGGTAALSGSVSLAPSRIGAERVDTAELRFALDEGLLDLDGEARTMEGRAVLVATARPLEDVPTFQVERLSLEGLRPDSSWTGSVPLGLSATLDVVGSLPAGRIPDIEGSLRLEPSSVNGARIEGGTARFAVRDSRATLDATVRPTEGRVELDAEAFLTRDSVGAVALDSAVASGVVELPALHELLQRTRSASLSARFDVSAARPSTGARDWTAALEASGSLGTARVDALGLSARVAAGVLHLDTLFLASNVAHASGGGAVALLDSPTAGELGGVRVVMAVDSLGAVAREMGVSPLSVRNASLEVHARNPGDGVHLQAILGTGGVIAAEFGADTLSGVATATVRGRALVGATARLRGSELGWGAARFETLGVDGAYDPENGTQVALDARRDEGHELAASGVVIPADSTLRLDRLRITLPDQEWRLSRPATLGWGGRISSDGLALVAGEDGRIALEGYLEPGRAHDLTLTLVSVGLEGFAELAGVEGLDGALDGQLAIAGPTDDVAVNGRLVGVVADARLEASVRPDPGGMRVTTLLSDPDGGSLRVDGTVPLPTDPPGDAALDVTAREFSLEWLVPFLRPLGVERLEGRLAADAHLEGPLAELRARGTAGLERGALRIPEQGVVYRDIRSELELLGDRVAVRELHLEAGGTADVEGEIILLPRSVPRFDLQAGFDEFRALSNKWTRLGLSGEVTVTGDLESPELRGSVNLTDTDAFADEVGEGGSGTPVELTRADYEMLETYFGYVPSEAVAAERDPLLPWAIDMEVTLGNDVWLRKSRQPQLRMELEGSLDVAKAPGDSIRLFGTIEVAPERSFFEEFGRRFEVSTGTVTFNGPLWGWRTELVASYPVTSFRDPSAPEVEILLEVSGGMEDLSVTLSSEPAMETADILSYIATGRPAESAVQFGGSPGENGGTGGVVGVGASLAMDRATAALESFAAESVALDVLEVRQQGLAGTTLVAGRYVSPRLFVGFQQPLTVRSRTGEGALGRTVPSTEVQLEYSAFDWLVVNLRGGQSTVSFFLRTKYAF